MPLHHEPDDHEAILKSITEALPNGLFKSLLVLADLHVVEAPCGDRTHDFSLTERMLHQLS